MTILVAVGGIAIFDKMQSQTYDGATTLIVKQTISGGVGDEDYNYDGYYAVMANQTFADTLESWLDSPEIVAEVYEKAGLDVPSSMNFLANRFNLDKVVSQTVSVRVNAGSQEEARVLLEAMNEVLRQKVESMLVDSQGQPVFTTTSSKILVTTHEIDYRMQFGVGIVAALALGVFLAYFVYAIKED